MNHTRVVHSLILVLFVMSCTGCKEQWEHNPAENFKANKAHRPENAKSDLSREKGKGYAAGEILVKFKEGTQEEVIESIKNELHLETLRVISRPHLYLMKITDGLSVEEMAKCLQRFKAVVYAEPNYLRSIQ